MKTHRSWQRQCARLGAICVVVAAPFSLIALESATATATEPGVEIGESRSIERPESSVAPAPDAVRADDSAVPGVAVAGVAIARDAAPVVASRRATDVANGGTNPLPFFVGGLGAAAALAAALWLCFRRARTVAA